VTFIFFVLLFIKQNNEIKQVIELVKTSFLSLYITVHLLLDGQQVSVDVGHRIEQLFHYLLLLELENIQVEVNVIGNILFFVTKCSFLFFFLIPPLFL